MFFDSGCEMREKNLSYDCRVAKFLRNFSKNQQIRKMFLTRKSEYVPTYFGSFSVRLKHLFC